MEQENIVPALTDEAEQTRLVYLAQCLAEKQLREGTASSQVIVELLRMGRQKARLEEEKLKHETKLLEAKTRQINDSGDLKQTIEAAMNAFRGYAYDEYTGGI